MGHGFLNILRADGPVVCKRQFRRVLAAGLSGVINPPIVAAAVFALMICRTDEPVARLGVLLGICLVFGTLLPTMYVGFLLVRRDIDSFFIPQRAARLRPLLVGSGSCLVGLVLLRCVSAPPEVCGLMLCYVVHGVLVGALTFQWKVSLHAVGAWGPLAGLVWLFGPSALFLVPVPLAVSWARVELGAHTPAQVVLGGGMAFFSAWLLFEWGG